MKLGHNYYVYIVECSDLSYYVGITNDIDRRVEEHNEGADTNTYTFTRRPVVLKYYEHFFEVDAAIVREKQLKGWSRKKKEALIEGNIFALKEYSKSRKKRE